MIGGNKLAEPTIEHFFEMMNSNGVNYAVLRNYEEYPVFGHDVDVVAELECVPRIRDIIASMSDELRWDLVVECGHWNGSPHEAQNIHIFKFFRMEPFSFLQIDIFNSFLVLSMPFHCAGEFIENRVFEPRGFYRIDAAIENVFRLLQIHSLCKSPANREKVRRYQQKIVDFERDNGDVFRNGLECKLGRAGWRGWLALRNREIDDFYILIWFAKIGFIVRAAVKSPVIFMSAVIYRAIGYIEAYFTRQCGVVVSADMSDLNSVQNLRNALEILHASNAIPKWYDDAAHTPGITRTERKILERGGVVVKSRECGRVTHGNILKGLSVDDLLRELVVAINVGHTKIFTR